MKTASLFVIVATIVLCHPVEKADAAVAMFEGLVNVDGVVSANLTTNPVIPGVNLAGFDTTTGLGTVLITVSGAGSHFAGLYLDLEIDEAVNTFFNETGNVTGAPPAGLSWELDEPGFDSPPGDIYSNFNGSDETGSLLDNTFFGGPALIPNDVAAALGWSFVLGAGETATLAFSATETVPRSSFYLIQTDPDSNKSVYFVSTLNIDPGGTAVPDGGQTLAMLAASVTLLGAMHRQKSARRRRREA